MSRELEETVQEVVKVSDELHSRIANVKTLLVNGTETVASGSTQSSQVFDELKTLKNNLESLQRSVNEANESSANENLDVNDGFKEKILLFQANLKNILNDMEETKSKHEEALSVKIEVDEEHELELADEMDETE